MHNNGIPWGFFLWTIVFLLIMVVLLLVSILFVLQPAGAEAAAPQAQPAQVTGAVTVTVKVFLPAVCPPEVENCGFPLEGAEVRLKADPQQDPELDLVLTTNENGIVSYSAEWLMGGFVLRAPDEYRGYRLRRCDGTSDWFFA